jgi:hypothetical protein
VKVDGSLKTLLQGVSQQPQRDRLPGQATAQENMNSDPVTGLGRRPPTDLVSLIVSTPSVRGWHDFKTPNGGKYLAMFFDGQLRVTDLNGAEQTVSYGSGATSYLTVPGELRCITIDNTTYVVNRSVKASMKSDTAQYLNSSGGGAIIQILGGQYGRTYKIEINGIEKATHTTTIGDEASDVAFLRTSVIASALHDKLITGLSGEEYTVVRKDDILYIRHPTQKFTCTITDDDGNVNVKACTDQVERTEDLPRLAPHLFPVRIAEKNDPEEDMWFKFVAEGHENDTTPNHDLFGINGYWQECVAPGTKTTIDPATMPHVLEYDPETGAFTFKRLDWKKRAVGTSVSNPDPSFIGNAIMDVSTFQGRLVCLAGSSLIMSRTNKPTDFFIGSLSAQADTDPIDIKSRVKRGLLLSIVEHNKDLVVFSSTGQFLVSGRTALTPQNAAMNLTTAFEADLTAKPVSAGNTVFFGAGFGEYTYMREFFADGNVEINDSRPIGQHVKKYIAGKAFCLTASSNYEILLVHADANKRDVFVYQYIWNDNEKVQSAWHKWTFQYPIVYSFFDEELVYMVQQVGQEHHLLRMSLDIQETAGVPYPVFLDQRFDVFDVYEAFTLPYDYMHDDPLVFVQGENCPTPGLVAKPRSIVFSEVENAYVVTLDRNMDGGSLLCGSRFKSRYVPTMPFVKDSDGVAIATGKLRIRSLLVSVARTGHIAGRVLSEYEQFEPVEFNGRIVGQINNQVGEQPLSDDTFTMPFRQNARYAEVEFYTETHLPMTMLDIEWVGQYTKRGRRISTGE